ncbi:MAG: Protein phosphatase methylesterase 1 [Candelina mexicana]|nr:MAG: Protein phosphatase methylesterase 1 [Candelina mexicana]
MSDFQKSFLKAKLASLPPEAPMPPDVQREAEPEEEDEVNGLSGPCQEYPDDDSSSASSASSTGTIRPIPRKDLFARPTGTSPWTRSFQMLPWTDYFSQELYLERKTKTYTLTHHVYINPPVGSGPLFVTHHGAGSSGLSFAALTAELRKVLPTAGVLSPDARGHGETVVHSKAKAEESKDDDMLDFGLETLSNDLLEVIRLMQTKLGWKVLPDLILVGHSLGGAIVTDIARKGHLGDRVLAYAVLDVVEGSAIDALQSMQTYLSSRPSSFRSLESAVEWHFRSRTIRNTLSARASVPSLLVHAPRQTESPGSLTGQQTWVWRTDLAATQPFWEGWFIGMSQKFLEGKGGKLLLLAGTDRLDKELMIGQMQGKYQLQVFPDAGHFIHEDLPEKTAISLVDFYKRNDRSALVLPPKVSEMLKKGAGRPAF